MTQSVLRLKPRPRCSPAREIQQDIHHLERSIDEVLAGGGTLLTRVLRVGLENGLSTDLTQATIEHTLACLNAGVSMRAKILATHEELREVSSKIDLRELGWGDLVNSPKTGISSADVQSAV